MSRYTNYIGENYFTIIKGKEEEFNDFINSYDFGETLLHLLPPKEIKDGWGVRFGYDDLSTDINHFDPNEQVEWFEELSTFIEEDIKFICTDEEFPQLNEIGYAFLLKCSKGKGEIKDLVLKEVVEK